MKQYIKKMVWYHFEEQLNYKQVYTAQCRDLGFALAHAEGLAATLNARIRVWWIKDGVHHTIVVWRPCGLDSDGVITERAPEPVQLDIEDRLHKDRA